jgi:hypothetical protein
MECGAGTWTNVLILQRQLIPREHLNPAITLTLTTSEVPAV